MKMIRFLAVLFLAVSAILIMLGLRYQLYQAQQNILCLSHLSHWGTAWQILRPGEGNFSTPLPELCAKWQSCLYAPETAQCPLPTPCQGYYTYLVNGPAVSDYRGGFLAPAVARNTVLLFDGQLNTSPFTSGEAAYRRIANRHLGGANLLFFDGSVVSRSAYAEGLSSGDVGWKNDGGYQWTFP